MALTWNDLFMTGSIVHLHTGRWRARAGLSPRDLGIEDTEAVKTALALGAHKLAPSEAFCEIDECLARARTAVDLSSMSFDFIRGSRYVPEANVTTLVTKLRDCRTAFEYAVQNFMSSYGSVKEQMLPIIEQALRDAARTSEAAQAAYSKLVDEYPSASDVQSKFRLSWSVYAISGPQRAGAAAALESEAESVRGVVKGMISDLRAEVSSKLTDVLAVIQRGGRLPKRSIESAMAVLEHIDAVNVLGDEVLTRQVAGLRQALRAIDPDSDVPTTTVTGLDDVKRALNENLEQAVVSAEAKLTALGRRKLVAV